MVVIKGKKKLVSKFLFYIGLTKFLRFYQSKWGKKYPIILAYHDIVKNINLISNSYFCEETPSATLIEFYKQIKFISKNYDVITFEELSKRLKIGGDLKNTIIITFDDGYRNNYKIAYPILKEFKVPAVFYLTTDYIGTDQVFWYEELNYIINHTEKNKISFSINDKIYSFPLDNKGTKKKSKDAILSLFKNISNLERIKICKELKNFLGVEIPPGEGKKMILSWEEIKEMSDNGMEFGSHTKSHPIVSMLTDEALLNELAGSKKEIEKRINRNVYSFAYPFGHEGTFSDRDVEIVERCGYDFAVTYLPGFNSSTIVEQEPYLLNRVHVELDINFTMFCLKLISDKI